jgi:hypothetical protein
VWLAVGASFALAVPAAETEASAAPNDRAQKCAADSYRGQEERDRGAFVEARASFRSCALDECPSLIRKDCGQWLSEVEANMPTVVVGAKDARGNDVMGARVLVDGQPHSGIIESGRAFALDPGPHTFRFDHPPDAPVEVTAVLRMGEHNRPIVGTFAAASPVLVAPPAQVPEHPAPPPVAHTSVSPWAYGTTALSVAGLASFAVFGALGLDQKNQLRASCGNTCSDSQVSPLKTKYIVADTSLGIGLLAGAIATWLFFHPSVDATAPSIAVTISPGAGSAHISLVRTF